MSHNPNFLLDAMSEIADVEREKVVRAPFAWPGGKSRALDKVLPMLPVRKTFVDGCGGSGVIMLNRPPSTLDVFNDRHTGVIAFYRCLRDQQKMQQLRTRLENVVHSREEFVWSRDTWEHQKEDIERAARWYYSIRFSFASLGRNFARSTNGINQNPKAYFNSLDAIPEIHRRFRNVLVENLDVVQCIRDFDNPDTVFYIDPDYIGTDPGIYSNRVDHCNLLDTVRDSRGFFAVSGYPNDLYDSKTFWTDRIEWKQLVTINAKAYTEENNRKRSDSDQNQYATEVLWIKESK